MELAAQHRRHSHILMLFDDFSRLVSPTRSAVPTGRTPVDLRHVINASSHPKNTTIQPSQIDETFD